VILGRFTSTFLTGRSLPGSLPRHRVNSQNLALMILCWRLISLSHPSHNDEWN